MKKRLLIVLLLIGCSANVEPEHVVTADESLTVTRSTWPNIGVGGGVGPEVMDGLADWSAALSSRDINCSYAPSSANRFKPDAFMASCSFTVCIYNCATWNTSTDGYSHNGQWHSTSLKLLGTEQGAFQFAVSQSMGQIPGYDSGYLMWREYSYNFNTYLAYGQIEQRISDGQKVGVFQR